MIIVFKPLWPLYLGLLIFAQLYILNTVVTSMYGSILLRLCFCFNIVYTCYVNTILLCLIRWLADK